MFDLPNLIWTFCLQHLLVPLHGRTPLPVWSRAWRKKQHLRDHPEIQICGLQWHKTYFFKTSCGPRICLSFCASHKQFTWQISNCAGETPLVKHLKYITQCSVTHWNTTPMLSSTHRVFDMTEKEEQTHQTTFSRPCHWFSLWAPVQAMLTSVPVFSTNYHDLTEHQSFQSNKIGEHRMELAWGEKNHSRTVGTFSHFLLCSLAAADSSLI